MWVKCSFVVLVVGSRAHIWSSAAGRPNKPPEVNISIRFVCNCNCKTMPNMYIENQLAYLLPNRVHKMAEVVATTKKLWTCDLSTESQYSNRWNHFITRVCNICMFGHFRKMTKSGASVNFRFVYFVKWCVLDAGQSDKQICRDLFILHFEL